MITRSAGWPRIRWKIVAGSSRLKWIEADLVTPEVKLEVDEPMLPCGAGASSWLGSGRLTLLRPWSWRRSVAPPGSEPDRSIFRSTKLSLERSGIQPVVSVLLHFRFVLLFSNRTRSPKFKPTLASLAAFSIRLDR